MSSFILFPKRGIERRKNRPISNSMQHANRVEHLKKLEIWRNSDEVSGPTHESIVKSQTQIGIEIKSVSELPLSGLISLQSEDDSLEALNEQFLDHHVVKDHEIGLNYPKQFSIPNVELYDSDEFLWHHDRLDLDQYRNEPSHALGRGIKVAVVDSGVKDIRTLRSKFSPNSHYIYDPIYGEVILREEDRHGSVQYPHGTAVSDILSGEDTGIAPECRLIDIACSLSDRATLAGLCKSIDFVHSLPDVSILNCSQEFIGLENNDIDVLEDIFYSLLDVGVFPVVAVGNQHPNAIPAPGRLRSCFSVGASNSSDELYRLSSGGTIAGMEFWKPDAIAPGENIFAFISDDESQPHEGTSFAAPIVSAIAALILEEHSHFNQEDLKDELLALCTPMGIMEEREGAGLIGLPFQPSLVV